jgi:transposase
MGHRTLVPDAGEVVLHELKAVGQSRLVMVLRSTGRESCCPTCGQASRRIHSRYCRHLSDLPWEGIPVGILLQVRRFSCGAEACGQHIFTERLPKTVQRYGRRTCRLSSALNQITLVLGGSAGCRLARQLGILASGSTLLRQLKKKAAAAIAATRVVGIDEWAWRKGHRYGTIFCDLEKGKVIDLLADRSVDSTEAWLRAHPGIEIVSRDRSSVYSEAAVRAAPQATQIADRWHLLRNLSEALTGALAPHHRLMVEAAQAARGKPSPDAVDMHYATIRMSQKEAARQRSRERRMVVYETAMELVRGGLPQPDVARRLSIDGRTIRRWVESNGFPEQRPRWRKSSLDRYRDYLEQRWQQGCHNAAQLWRELREKGFKGRPRIVRDWMLKHHGTRASEAKKETTVPPVPRISPRQTAWHVLKQSESSLPYLEELFRRSPEIATAATVAREFFRVVRKRDLAAWEPWLQSALESPLVSFAKHLSRDAAAVKAALEHGWSNGPVEGNVHRLKLIKRSMYGRASFDLLRIRVLNAA